MPVKLNSTGGGSVTLDTPSTASNYTITLPAATSTLLDTTSTQTLTNKTLTAAGSNTVEATSGPTSSQLAGNRNKIINGAMMIDQRNAGAAVTVNATGYTLDRWLAITAQSGKYSVQQNAGSVSPPSGFANYIGVTSLSAYSSGAGDAFLLNHYVEGLNSYDFGWGTSGAVSATLSFWVRSSLTGTFSLSVCNQPANSTYITNYTINSANTWEYKTITIPAQTAGSWNTNNTVGVQIRFDLGSGSNYNGTAGSWITSNLLRTSGSQSVVGTNGATFYITGVQLEKGASATPFENRLYGTELALCQRYYQKSWNQSEAAGTSSHVGGIHVLSWGDGNAAGISWQVPMRTNPTVTFYPTTSTTAGSVNSGGTDRTASATYPSERGYSFIAVTSGTANTYTRFQYIASAEL